MIGRLRRFLARVAVALPSHRSRGGPAQSPVRGGDDFELVARNSVFTLAPAGYGRWTYRFVQAIRGGSLPVLLSNDYVKPFGDRIPYDDFSLTIPEGDLDQIDSILRSIDEDRIREYQEALARHQHDFTEAFFRNLTSELEARL